MTGDQSKFDNARLDYLIRCMNVNPEYIEEKRQETIAWRQEVLVRFREWQEEMKRFIPSSANRASLDQLVDMGLSRALATRMTTKKCLWLIKMDPEAIKKIHIADLRGKFSYQSQNLDIVELAAIYMSLPDKFENDSGNQKQAFRSDLEEKLKVMYKELKSNKLKITLVRNPMYKGVDAGRFRFDDGDFGGYLSFGVAASEGSSNSSNTESDHPMTAGGGDGNRMRDGNGGSEVGGEGSTSLGVVRGSSFTNMKQSGSFSSSNRTSTTTTKTALTAPKALNPDLTSTLNPLLEGLLKKKREHNV
jgi:hypothetical protein